MIVDVPVDHDCTAIRIEDRVGQPQFEREIEVLCLIANGASNREIAEQLVVSEGTVKNHISSILSRLGLRDRTQAAIYAREHDVL